MWVSVVSLPRDGCPTFPFTCLDPESGKHVTLRDDQDVQRLFNSWKWNPENGKDPGKWNERRFEYARLLGIGHMFIESSFQDLIKRKRYCERFNCPPFDGAYDEQPEWWKLAVTVMDNAEAEATNYLRRK